MFGIRPGPSSGIRPAPRLGGGAAPPRFQRPVPPHATIPHRRPPPIRGGTELRPSGPRRGPR
jgi:hypothetical protein